MPHYFTVNYETRKAREYCVEGEWEIVKAKDFMFVFFQKGSTGYVDRMSKPLYTPSQYMVIIPTKIEPMGNNKAKIHYDNYTIFPARFKKEIEEI